MNAEAIEEFREYLETQIRVLKPDSITARILGHVLTTFNEVFSANRLNEIYHNDGTGTLGPPAIAKQEAPIVEGSNCRDTK